MQSCGNTSMPAPALMEHSSSAKAIELAMPYFCTMPEAAQTPAVDSTLAMGLLQFASQRCASPPLANARDQLVTIRLLFLL